MDEPALNWGYSTLTAYGRTWIGRALNWSIKSWEVCCPALFLYNWPAPASFPLLLPLLLLLPPNFPRRLLGSWALLSLPFPCRSHAPILPLSLIFPLSSHGSPCTGNFWYPPTTFPGSRFRFPATCYLRQQQIQNKVALLVADLSANYSNSSTAFFASHLQLQLRFRAWLKNAKRFLVLQSKLCCFPF